MPLQTVEGQADGIAEATNRSGLSVGYLGNLGTEADPEHDQFAVWPTRTGAPLLLGPVHDNLIAEFVDVNDRGQVVGMTGTLNPISGFGEAQGVTWQRGWESVKPLAVPSAARKHAVLVTQLNDVNNRGAVVGNVFGLAAKDYGALRAIYPVVWTCAFGR